MTNMNLHRHRWIGLLLLAALLAGCAGGKKDKPTGSTVELLPSLKLTDGRGSTGSWTCSTYNTAMAESGSAWGPRQLAQEYIIGYVMGLFEGQGKNQPVTAANIEAIRRLLDSACQSAPRLSLQQAANGVGQTLYRQYGRSRGRSPVPPADATPAMPCARYNDSRLSDAAEAVIARYAADNWADGYVTALLDSAHRIYEPNGAKARVLRALQTTCADNPKLTVQDAADMVAKPLIAASARDRSGRQRAVGLDDTTDF